MISIKNRTQILFKLLITGIFIYTLYFQLFQRVNLDESYTLFSESFQGQNLIYLVLFMIFFLFNWGIESWKWKFLLAKFYPQIRFVESVKSVMTGLTFAIMTPARLGEYGGRIISVPTEYSVSALAAHFFGSMVQNAVILVFGCTAWVIFYFYEGDHLEIPFTPIIWSTLIILLIILLFFISRRYLLQKLKSFKFPPKIHKRIRQLSIILKYSTYEISIIFALTAIRVTIFYTQYWLLLKVFGLSTGWIALVIIALIYFVQTLIPLPAVFNWFVRGELALFFWGYLNVDDLVILVITYSLWLINLVFPAIIGLIVLGKFDFTKWIKNEKT